MSGEERVSEHCTDGKEGHTHEREADQAVAWSEEFRPFERHQRCINRASLVLNSIAVAAVIAGVYVANATLRSINESVVEAGRSAAAAEGALEAARDGIEAQNSLIESSQRQMDLTLQQIEDARNALWLEQRPWLGYVGYALEARANDDEPWVEQDLREGDQVRVRMRIENSGRTPAILIPVNSDSVRVLPVGSTAPPPREWRRMSAAQAGVVVLPGVEGQRHYTRPFRLSRAQFEGYSAGTHQLFLWARLNYCDAAQRRHWVQVAITHQSRDPPDIVGTPSASISPDPGGLYHPDCQGQDSGAVDHR